MRVGAVTFFLPSKPYMAGIPVGWLIAKPPVTCWFLAWLTFYNEDGGDTFLQNVGSHTDYMAVYSRR
jgi:hypothetical protein